MHVRKKLRKREMKREERGGRREESNLSKLDTQGVV